MTEDKPIVCSFCGRSIEEVEVMLRSNYAQICDECIDTGMELVKEHKRDLGRGESNEK